jgi:RNA polymerase sigma factor (sigma-70 family)
MIEDHRNLERQCSSIVDRLLSRYRWGLLDRDEFVERTIAAAQSSQKIDVQLIAFGIYNQALHRACSGAEGSARWELAYTELFVMLCDRARSRYPDVWEDAVQSAIESTCISIECCVEPRAFSAFAWQYFLNAVRSLRPHLRRKDKQLPLSLERSIGKADEHALGDTLLDPNANIIELLLTQEQRAEVRQILDLIEQEHQRAKKQIAAVRLKYLDGKDDDTIGQLLGVSVERVHELRSRGLKKLREDPRLRQLREVDG